MTRKCENCQWWVNPVPAGDGVSGSFGQCRAGPPHIDGGFPLVHETIWCGSFRLREGLETDNTTP